jgi:hypothetical protein
MAGFGDTAENSLLNLIYRATAWANVADNAASSPLTNIHVSLHTASPGDSGTLSTNESAYGNYARQNVARSTGWTSASGGSTLLAANLVFPASSGSATTVTDFATGKTGGGAAEMFIYGAISPTIPIGGAGVTPTLTTATTLSID